MQPTGSVKRGEGLGQVPSHPPKGLVLHRPLCNQVCDGWTVDEAGQEEGTLLVFEQTQADLQVWGLDSSQDELLPLDTLFACGGERSLLGHLCSCFVVSQGREQLGVQDLTAGAFSKGADLDQCRLLHGLVLLGPRGRGAGCVVGGRVEGCRGLGGATAWGVQCRRVTV